MKVTRQLLERATANGVAQEKAGRKTNTNDDVWQGDDRYEGANQPNNTTPSPIQAITDDTSRDTIQTHTATYSPPRQDRPHKNKFNLQTNTLKEIQGLTASPPTIKSTSITSVLKPPKEQSRNVASSHGKHKAKEAPSKSDQPTICKSIIHGQTPKKLFQPALPYEEMPPPTMSQPRTPPKAPSVQLGPHPKHEANHPTTIYPQLGGSTPRCFAVKVETQAPLIFHRCRPQHRWPRQP
jgi:hypothetical protein